MSQGSDPSDTSFSTRIKEITSKKLDQERAECNNFILKLLSASIKSNESKIISLAKSGSKETIIYTTQDREVCQRIRESLYTVQGAFGFNYDYKYIQKMSWLGFSRNDGCFIEMSWK